MKEVPIEAKVALRVHAVPDPSLPERPPRLRPPRRFPRAQVGHRLLVIVMEDEERGARPFRLGILRILERGVGGSYEDALPARLTEPVCGVILGDALPPEERARVRAWARGRGLRALSQQDYVHGVFFWEALREGALAATWDWGALLGSLAASWGKSRHDPGAFSITLCPRFRRKRTSRHHDASRHPMCPRLTVRRLSEPYVQAVSFAGRGAHGFPGRFFSLLEKTAVLTGAPHTFTSACRAFGIAPPPESCGLQSLAQRLDGLQARLDAVCALTVMIQDALLRHRAVITDEHEGVQAITGRRSVVTVHTSAGLGKAYLERMGVTTPPRIVLQEGLNLSADQVLGAAMATFHPGRTQVYGRDVPVAGLLCDLGRQYPTVASNSSHWDWWAAEYVEVRDTGDEARALLARAAAEGPEMVLDRAVWPRLNVLVLVHPRGDWLPVRLLIGEGREAEEVVLDAPLTIPRRLGPVWITLADALISTWRTGRPPDVIRALGFTPRGELRGLREVEFADHGTLDPRRDVFAQLIDLRGHLTAKGEPHLAQAAKVMANALSFGVAAELHPEKERDLILHDGVRTRHVRARYERPGPFYCPPLAALVTAGGRLQLFLLEHLVREAGGRCAMVAVDSAFITGPDPVAAYEYARDKLEALNTSTTMVPLLRPDAAHGTPPRPLVYMGVAVSRYYIGEDRRKRAPVPLKMSGQNLGSFLDPIALRHSPRGAGTPSFWREGWRWARGLRTSGRAKPPQWIDDPAPRVHVITTPGEAKIYRHGHGGIRPFQQILISEAVAHGGSVLPLAPLHLPAQDAGPRAREGKSSPLWRLPWVDARTGRRLRVVDDPERDLPRDVLLRTWRHVLQDHVRHPDLKDPDPLRRGWGRRVFHVTATGWRFRRKESVLPVDFDDFGSLMGEEERDYEEVSGDLERMRAILVPLFTAHPEALARRVGVSPRRLRAILTGKVTPRPHLAARIAEVAEEVARAGGTLPPPVLDGARSVAEAIRYLRARGFHPRDIAGICDASERTVWAWSAGASPRAKARARLRALLEEVAP